MGRDITGDDSGITLEENLKKAMTEVVLLHLLSQKDCYIGELTEAITAKSDGALHIVFPYGAIYRMQQAGYIAEKEKRNAPDGRRRQYFCITLSGQAYLNTLLDIYKRFTKGIADVLLKGEKEE